MEIHPDQSFGIHSTGYTKTPFFFKNGVLICLHVTR